MYKDNLGDRMKGYEAISSTKLIKRMPVILRLDGRAFHTFTKKFLKPFDEVMVTSMQQTMQYLCENIQGCVFGYTQSDEITLLLKDWQTFETAAWFDYKVQKMTSVAASMCSVMFNHYYIQNAENYIRTIKETNEKKQIGRDHRDLIDLTSAYLCKGPQVFDCRVFNLTKEEVCNNFIWRQQDAIRNSIQSCAQALFSAKELHGKNQSSLKEMLLTREFEWDTIDIYLQRGTGCIKKITNPRPDAESYKGEWMLDLQIPEFKVQRAYIEALLD